MGGKAGWFELTCSISISCWEATRLMCCVWDFSNKSFLFRHKFRGLQPLHFADSFPFLWPQEKLEKKPLSFTNSDFFSYQMIEYWKRHTVPLRLHHPALGLEHWIPNRNINSRTAQCRHAYEHAGLLDFGFSFFHLPYERMSMASLSNFQAVKDANYASAKRRQALKTRFGTLWNTFLFFVSQNVKAMANRSWLIWRVGYAAPRYETMIIIHCQYTSMIHISLTPFEPKKFPKALISRKKR